MKKFIVTQNRKSILEVNGSIEVVKDYFDKGFESYGIILNGCYIADGFTEDEARNQLLLIVDFLNRKNTINDAVYFMPEDKRKNKKYRLTIYPLFEESVIEPYIIDCDSLSDALNTKEEYENEVMMDGSKAYSVIGPADVY